MTAKIDTQAPDTIWAIRTCVDGAVELGSWADTVRYHGGGDEFIRADVVAAREAAAWIAGRDAALTGAEFLGGTIILKPATAHNTPPTDPAAALDRLIAEARRDVWDQAMRTVRQYEDEWPANAILNDLEAYAERDAARGSKEGQS